MVEADDHPFHGKIYTLFNTYDNGYGPENKWVCMNENDRKLGTFSKDAEKACPFEFHKVEGKPHQYFLQNKYVVKGKDG